MSEDQYLTHNDEKLRCKQCGHEFTGTVTVDDLSGVAVFTCPACDTTQEP